MKYGFSLLVFIQYELIEIIFLCSMNSLILIYKHSYYVFTKYEFISFDK